MQIRKKKRRRPIVPINAMSDIAFLLLIFIMLISLINYREEIAIEYAEADNQEKIVAEKIVEIWIDKDGAIYHNGKMVNIAAAENIISTQIGLNPAVRVNVLADRGTKYRHINQITAILQRLQHRLVSLVVSGKTE